MRLFIKSWCMSFGVLAGVELTLYDHPSVGLYLILLGLVLFVLVYQDERKFDSLQRRHRVVVDLMAEQFGKERACQLIDEYFISRGLVTREEVEKFNREHELETKDR